MSATNRGSTRKPHDFYPTPISTIETFLDVFPLRGGSRCWKGILNGGRCIAFEAKHTDADKIEASAVSDRQAELLENYEKMGASCFVLVSFKFEQFYRIPWSVWRDMKDIYGHKHLKRSEIQDYEIGLNHLGTLEFLKKTKGGTHNADTRA